MRGSVIALAALLAAAGCGEERMRPPPAPNPDGSTRDARVSPPPSSGGDGGMRDAGIDGAVPADGGMRGCTAIAAGDPDNALTVIQPGEVPPFGLEAAFIRWDDGNCDDPKLLIALTDGACEPGHGQQLLFAVQRDAIGGTVTAGEFILQPEPTPVKLTFSRPTPGAREERQVFGTCGDVLGSVTFDSVGDEAGAVWDALFSGVELAPCPDGIGPATTVDGRFRLELREDFTTACPPGG